MEKNLREEIAKISEIAQLDFEHDNVLFIDPYRINEQSSELAQKAKAKIIKYFGLFFKCVEENDREKALYLGKHLREINATKLGYTNAKSIPRGKGFSQRDLIIIFDEAIKVKNYIEDMPDILVLADKVGPDKVSDLTTNIIYEELLDFTLLIISKYNLDIDKIKKKKNVFNVEEEIWEKKELLIPCIDGEEILFIPNKIVSTSEIFSYGNVYQRLVYPFYKVNTAIHRLIRTLQSGEVRPDCKKIKEKYPLRRDTVKDFVINFRGEYNQYKNEMIHDYWRQ